MNQHRVNEISAHDRARAYATKVPPAITGQNGHNTTFKLAVKLTRGFNLSPEDAFPILKEWNEACQPPWSDADLWHKLKSADASGTEPRGTMLAVDRSCHRFAAPAPKTQAFPQSLPKNKPDLSSFARGKIDQIKEVAKHRAYALPGLLEASKRGFLLFGKHHGFPSYAITDRSGKAVACRRIDNLPFPFGEHPPKSLFLPESDPRWPVGTLESTPFPCIALFEGVPDFIEGCHVILWEGAEKRVAPVMMLSSSPAICETALPHFKNKTIRIFAHYDSAGVRGAEKWRLQLLNAGAAKVDFFDFGACRMPNGQAVKDFYDLQQIHVGRCLP
jgi:hypothetical protein